MNHPSVGGRRDDPAGYQICIQGHLGTRWADWFDGMTLTTHSDGTTVIEGAVVDQAALQGLLSKLRDLGLPLVSLTAVDVDPRSPSAASSGTPAAFWHTTFQGD
jgi:hypothetical protein